MNVYAKKNITLIVVAVAAIYCTVADCVYGSDGLQALQQLAHLEGEEYVARRDRLLTTHPEPWDVEAAAEYSWEVGLAAFILNARIEYPKGFAIWDAARPIRTRSGRLRYTEKTRFAGATAFLCEKVWKTAESDDVRHLCLSLAPGGRSVGPFALWRSVWQGAEADDVRAIAIEALAERNVPEARNLVVEALLSRSVSNRVHRAALRGLATGRPSHTTHVALQVLNSQHLDAQLRTEAVGILSGQAEPEAREALVKCAAGTTEESAVRCAALAACARDPKPGDVALFSSAIQDSACEEIRVCAIRKAIAYPIEEVRSVLRCVARDTTAPNIAQEAIRALVKHGTAQDIEFVQAVSEDETLPKVVRRFARNTLRNKAWKEERKAKRKNKP